MTLKVLKKITRGRTYRIGGVSDFDSLRAELSEAPASLVLLVAVDGRRFTDDQIKRVAHDLLNLGLCSLCVWGPDCERIHDLFDHAIVERNPHETDENVILTNWHDKDTLSEAVWFFRYCGDTAPGVRTAMLSMDCCRHR